MDNTLIVCIRGFSTQMLAKLKKKFISARVKFRHSFGKNLSTRSGIFWAYVHYNLFDHVFLRILWTNFSEISQGVSRSNQPTQTRLKKYKTAGLKTVVNLRGWDNYAHYFFEERACKYLDLKLINYKLRARNAPTKEEIFGFLKIVKSAEKPFLLHCKSGADRAGLASVLYLMEFEGASVETAMKQLSFRHIHLDFTQTGVIDYFFKTYEMRMKQEKIEFLHWVTSEYDAIILQNAFDKRLPIKEALDHMSKVKSIAGVDCKGSINEPH